MFHSADHVHLISAYLHVDELMQASELCRASHAQFDSDAVWLDRLRWAEHIQRMRESDMSPMPADAESLLSPAQLVVLPPLLSLEEVAVLCEAAIEKEVPKERRGWCSCLSAPVRRPMIVTAIVHTPSTLCYHTRIIRRDETYSLDYTVLYCEFTLQYSERERRWAVESGDFSANGWAAINDADNIGQHAGQNQHQSIQPLAASSNKQRYIDLQRCSEHEHNRCYRLLPPVLSGLALNNFGGARLWNIALEPFHPLPLCCSCRTLVTRCIKRMCFKDHSVAGSAYRVQGLTRINKSTCPYGSIYEISVTCDDHLIRYFTHFRVSVVRREQTERLQRWMGDGAQSSGPRWSEPMGYEVVAQYSHGSAVYKDEHNICARCQCGITPSGRGHTEGCDENTRKLP